MTISDVLKASKNFEKAAQALGMDTDLKQKLVDAGYLDAGALVKVVQDPAGGYLVHIKGGDPSKDAEMKAYLGSDYKLMFH